ncbi:hypothetical protein GCM10022223_47570 [Kineosporia mesophila]|uniref:DUF4352 domain-containing protein n=1 Tax=Kineosporia mesophila TaxID=566012 RepID=A0ABP7A4U0_9ACTN|nr:DUF4352 domain-containing protein [Kineosporia mesophila]MCD5351451.1 DUF4352 domain-containing protein [Kineosporia mesophila]
MARTNGRNRTRGSAPRLNHPRGKPQDTRGSWGAMISALLVAGLIFTAAVMLHYGELPAFLAPATSLGHEKTIETETGTGDAAQKIALVVSVPAAPKVSKADGDPAQRTVTVSVRVRNESEVPVEVPGAGQSLRTDQANSYDGVPDDSAKVAQVAAGKSRTVKLRFRVPDGETPAVLTLKVAGEQRKFDLS